MNNDAVLARLDDLEARIARLEAVTPSAKHPGDKAVKDRALGDWAPGQASFINGPAENEGVRIFCPAPISTFPMPSAAELQKLLVIVQRRFPALAPAFHDELSFFEGFSRAFLYVGNLGRSDELNRKVSVSWWIDACQDWLKRSNIHCDVISSCFIAACLAQGVDYIAADPAAGAVWTFGLKSYGVRRDNGDGWRRVLETGQVKPPAEAPAHATPQASVRFG